MKHLLLIPLFLLSTLFAAEDIGLQIQKLKESNYAACRDGFFAAGAFAGINSFVVLKMAYGANMSGTDFKQLMGADSVYGARAQYCQDRCYRIQDELRELDWDAWLTVYHGKNDRLAWITSGKHFLYGVAFGATLTAVLKTIYEPEKFQPHDVIIPTALVTLCLVTAKIADDHVKAAHGHIARKKDR
jgi:hypothetical protein